VQPLAAVTHLPPAFDDYSRLATNHKKAAPRFAINPKKLPKKYTRR